MPGPMAACAKVDRSDVAALQMRERTGQFGLQRGNELAARRRGGATARGRQTRTMLEASALVPDPNHAIPQFEFASARCR